MIYTLPVITPMLALGSSDRGERLQAARHLARHLSTPGYLETLRQHRLTPLIYQSMTSFSRKEMGNVPHLEELRQDYSWALKRCQAQERETHLFVELLSKAGVEVILLKGADIRHRLYEDPATRPMGDVDVLISPADLDKARTALEQQGYIVIPRDLDLQPDFAARFSYVLGLKTPLGDAPLVDVHWEIREVGTFYRLPYAPLRARAATREVQGRSALVLAPEHLLLHLCLHSFDELEYAGMHEDTARFRIQGPVWLILRELERLSPGAVPESVLRQLAAHRPSWVEKIILRREAACHVVASMAGLWRYLPLRAWAPYLKAKLWPSPAYLRANAREFPYGLLSLSFGANPGKDLGLGSPHFQGRFIDSNSLFW